MAILTSIWNGLKSLFALILPFLGGRSWRSIAPALRWVLHFIMLALVLVLLAYLNWHFDLEKSLRSPFPQLHRVWLPMLFLLVYLLGWMGHWLWRLLGPEHLSAEFPDIDDAWDEALASLRHAGLDVTETPMFLVLGRPVGREEALFSAAHMQWAVQQSPKGEGAPLHVYASREAIFVTCAESSALGRQARLFGGNPATESAAGDLPQRLEDEIQALFNRAKEQGRGPDQLNADEKVQLGELQAQKQAALVQRDSASKAPLLKNKPVVDELRARLEYVCRLILRDRRPYCPVNGILVVVPAPALRTEIESNQVAALVQADLQTARNVLDLECPTLLLVSDLQKAPGFRAFLEDVPVSQRESFLGQSFPLLPDVDPPQVAGMFDEGVSWLCQHQVLTSLFPKFRLEPSQGETPGRPGSALRKNFHLYQFWDYLRQARKRLARIAQRCAQTVDGAPPMVAGCFFAATGEDATQQQAFVSGAMRLLVQNQNYVTWTPQALAQERGYQSMTRAGYVLFLVLLVGLGGVGWWMWRG